MEIINRGILLDINIKPQDIEAIKRCIRHDTQEMVHLLAVKKMIPIIALPGTKTVFILKAYKEELKRQGCHTIAFEEKGRIVSKDLDEFEEMTQEEFVARVEQICELAVKHLRSAGRRSEKIEESQTSQAKFERVVRVPKEEKSESAFQEFAKKSKTAHRLIVDRIQQEILRSERRYQEKKQKKDREIKEEQRRVDREKIQEKVLEEEILSQETASREVIAQEIKKSASRRRPVSE